jgi:hypothetical protein
MSGGLIDFAGSIVVNRSVLVLNPVLDKVENVTVDKFADVGRKGRSVEE